MVDNIQSAVPGTIFWAATRQVFACPKREAPDVICSSLSNVGIGYEQTQDLGVEEDISGEIIIIDNEACPPSTNIGGNTGIFVERLDNAQIDKHQLFQ